MTSSHITVSIGTLPHLTHRFYVSLFHFLCMQSDSDWSSVLLQTWSCVVSLVRILKYVTIHIGSFTWRKPAKACLCKCNIWVQMRAQVKKFKDIVPTATIIQPRCCESTKARTKYHAEYCMYATVRDTVARRAINFNF